MKSIKEVVADWPAAGCVHASYEERPEPPPAFTHVPFTAKQPPEILIPPLPYSVEVAVVKFATPCIESMDPGVVVPIPSDPPIYAVPVVVAFPEIVRPPSAVPFPMVVEACAVRPPLNCVSVDVAFPASGNG